MGSNLYGLLKQKQFTLGEYESLVLKYSLSEVWDALIQLLKELGIEEFGNKYVDFYDIGRLYEIGLAVENKYSKKEAGKYYTPKDVSDLMAELLIENSNINHIADVGCGCGNLIIEVLQKIKDKSDLLFKTISHEIYIYDLDKTAIKICKARISVLFNLHENSIHAVCGDFLSKKAKIPENCYIISNPPYSQIKVIDSGWEFKSAITESKDLYVGFIEKMIRNAKKAVIVSPQSYIVGSKFSGIRKILFESGCGEIYSFDNVPGTLFNGRKQGVFNTNTANGVRASILVFNKSEAKGYHLTHLIRFKTDEREKIININYVKNQLGLVAQDLTCPLKCFKELEDFVYSVRSNKTFEDLVEKRISEQNTKYCIHINSSARYFIVGSAKELNRNGNIDVYAKDEESFYLLYALLNSSYAYLWWRMFDGGILVPKNLLLQIPLPKKCTFDSHIVDYCKEMIRNESKYLVYKKNAGIMQESIKFPNKYREELNKMMFGDVCFELIHSNKELL